MNATRSLVVVSYADEVVRAPQLLRRFADRYDNGDDVTLVLYAPGEDASILLDELGPLVARLGLDGEDAPDLLALAPPADPGSERALAEAAHAVLSDEPPRPGFATLPHFRADEVDRLPGSRLPGSSAASAATTPGHYLSVCTIFKDEAAYLREWIEFHRVVGVEHFYLYDNGSGDDFRAVLAPYEERGLVTLLDWPLAPRGQCPAYTDCLRRFGTDSQWIAFIDVDEFLHSPETPDLRAVLEGYEQFGGVAVNMIQYGTSGLERKPDGLVIESYLRRAGHGTAVILKNGLREPQLDRSDVANYHPLNARVKSVVQPRHVLSYDHPHHPTYQAGHFGVDERRVRADGAIPGPVHAERLRINHYWTKSIEECRQKFERGDVNYEHGRKWPGEFLHRDEALNEELDCEILQFAPATRAALGLPPAAPSFRLRTAAEAGWAARVGDTVRTTVPAVRREVPSIIADAGPQFASELARYIPWPEETIRERLFFPGDPVDVPISMIGGLPIRVVPGTSHVRTLRGTFDRRYHLPPDGLDPKVIVDLGANIGTTMADYAHVHPQAYVVGVELDEENAALAQINTLAFGDRIRVIHAGASDRDGELRYSRQTGNEWGFALAEYGDTIVRTLTLDSILAEAGLADTVVDFLKVDIEGAEREVLRAGGAWASRVRCLKIELHGAYSIAEAVHDVEKLGFATRLDAKHHACVVGVATRL